jgi:hypothetical protein
MKKKTFKKEKPFSLYKINKEVHDRWLRKKQAQRKKSEDK